MMKKQLEQLIEFPETYMLQAGGNYELISEIGFLRSIIKYQNYKIVIYGANDRANYLVNCLKCERIKIDCFIDADKMKHLQKFRNEYVIYHIDALPEYLKNKNVLALVAVRSYKQDPEKIITPLVQNGISKIIYPFAKENYLAPYKFEWEPYQYSWISYFMNNKEQILSVYDLLNDEVSRETFCDFIKSYLTIGVFEGKQRKSCLKYFECYRPLEKEIFLNIGSYIGDTIFYFIENRKEIFEKIYAYEGNTSHYKALINNLNILPEHLRGKIETYPIYLNEAVAYKLEEEPITLINMDIEGTEESVILGLEGCIKRNRPVLAICAYHKPSDIIRLPQLIIQMADDYHIYFRKYASPFSSRLEVAELVMYAVPKERRVDG